MKNTKGIIIAVVLLIAAVAAFVLIKPKQPTAKGWPQVYFYDMGKGETYVGPKNQIPPTQAPGGQGEAVWAAVYSCGDCADVSTHKVAYLEKFSPEAKGYLESAMATIGNSTRPEYQQPFANIPVGQELVASVDEPNTWLDKNAEGATIVRDGMASICDGQQAKMCTPPAK